MKFKCAGLVDADLFSSVGKFLMLALLCIAAFVWPVRKILFHEPRSLFICFLCEQKDHVPL